MRAILVIWGGLALAATPAVGQMVLPGAVAPAPVGSSSAPSTGGPPKPAAPPPVRAPGEDAVVGKELRWNGATGIITLERQDKDLRITRLTLPGNQISRPADVCRVDVAGGPFTLKASPRREGLLHFQSEIEACPIAIDVLDGAVQVTVQGGVCTFANADCKTSPGGVWGPPAASIGPAEAKNIERLRAAADKNGQAYFKALLANTKDRQQVKSIAADQAAFSSKREEACRDYAKEDVHGFCASRMTEARAIALRAKLYSAEADKPEPAKKPPPKKKPQPAMVSGEAPPAAPRPVQPAPVRPAAPEKSFMDNLLGR